MPPTPAWPQGKGQTAECPVPSRTHYTRRETKREQRSLCDSIGQKQTDTQRWRKGEDEKGVSSFSTIIIGIKSPNEE